MRSALFILLAATSACGIAACSSAAGSGAPDADGGSSDGGAGSGDGAAGRDGSRPPNTFDGGSVSAHVNLTGCPQEGFTGSFDIGGNPFALIFDTGSAEVGVVSKNCADCSGANPTYSGSTGVDQGNTVSVSYVSGTGWSGEVFRDSFGTADVAASTRLVSITSQSGGFFNAKGCGFGKIDLPFQGIAGFGPAALADPRTDDPMTALSSGDAGLADVLAYALCDTQGELWIGGYGAEAAPQTTPLLNTQYYEITVNDLTVGGTALGSSHAAIGNVVVDSDTTELELPNAVYQSLRTAIESDAAFQAHVGSAGWFDAQNCTVPIGGTSPSDLDSLLPTLALRIDDGKGGSFDLELKATQSYIEPVSDGTTLYLCPEIESALGSSTVLGSAALRRELVVVDRTAKTMGFAPYSGCP